MRTSKPRVYGRTNGAEKAASQASYTVAVDWVDGHVEDTDEITVTAASASGATSKARAEWRRTNGKKYPSCRMCGAWVMTPARLDAIGS